MRKPRTSRSSTTARSVSSSLSRFSTFRSCWAPAIICGAGWIVPRQVLSKGRQGRFFAEADRRRPVQAGVAGTRAANSSLRRSRITTGRCMSNVSRLIGVPEAATRLAMIEREEADIMYLVPGELPATPSECKKIMLAPVVSGSWWLEFPGFQDPKNPFRDKRVRRSGFASRSTARQSTTPKAAGWAASAATGSTTTSNMRSTGRSSSSISPRRRS